RKREVAHFASGFLAAAGLDQLVIGPESAVQECDMARRCGFHALAGILREARCKAKGLSSLFKAQRQHRLRRWKSPAELGADEVGKVAAERRGRTNKRWRSRRIFAEAAGKACAGRQCLPQDGRIGAVQDVKHTIFVLEQALHRGRGKYEKRLKLTEMKQAHH